MNHDNGGTHTGFSGLCLPGVRVCCPTTPLNDNGKIAGSVTPLSGYRDRARTLNTSASIPRFYFLWGRALSATVVESITSRINGKSNVGERRSQWE